MSYFFKETQYEKTKGMCSNCWTVEYHDYVLEVRTVSVGKCFPPEQLFNVVGVSAVELGISRFMVCLLRKTHLLRA